MRKLVTLTIIVTGLFFAGQSLIQSTLSVKNTLVERANQIDAGTSTPVTVDVAAQNSSTADKDRLITELTLKALGSCSNAYDHWAEHVMRNTRLDEVNVETIKAIFNDAKTKC